MPIFLQLRHMSYEDVHDAHRHVLHPMPVGSRPLDEVKETYLREDRLAKFGFAHGWLGPDPHGPKLENSGFNRDARYNNLIQLASIWNSFLYVVMSMSCWNG